MGQKWRIYGLFDNEQYLGSGAYAGPGVVKGDPNRYCLVCSQPLGTDQRAITTVNIDELVGQCHRQCLPPERPTRKAAPPPQAPQPNASASEPLLSRNQCVICSRPVQDGERLVRRAGHVAHESCVRAVLDLLGRGEVERPVARTPEPTRKSAATQEERQVARAIAELIRHGGLP